MSSKKFYNLLVLLLPIIYLIHNLEEWLVFRTKAIAIIQILPKNFSSFLPDNPATLVSIFGMSVVFATLIPAIVSIFLWGRFTSFNAKILMIVAFVTLINAISHITSSVFLGFISPGLITGIALCIPYAIGLAIFVIKHFPIKVVQYLFLGFISIAVYFLGIIISWVLGMLLVGLLST